MVRKIVTGAALLAIVGFAVPAMPGFVGSAQADANTTIGDIVSARGKTAPDTGPAKVRESVKGGTCTDGSGKPIKGDCPAPAEIHGNKPYFQKDCLDWMQDEDGHCPNAIAPSNNKKK